VDNTRVRGHWIRIHHHHHHHDDHDQHHQYDDDFKSSADHDDHHHQRSAADRDHDDDSVRLAYDHRAHHDVDGRTGGGIRCTAGRCHVDH